MLIAVDIGNHKTLFAGFPQGVENPETRLVSTNDLKQPDALLIVKEAIGMVSGGAMIDRIAIAGVVPGVVSDMLGFCKTLGYDLFELNHQVCGISLRYNPPSDLGPDRIANAIALKHLCGGPSLCVDLGTATTFDVISVSGDFAGGAIAAGMDTAAAGLWTRTARLKNPGWRIPAKALGQSTSDCLLSGLVYGYAGLVEHMIALLAKEAGPFCAVIATGGMAEFVGELCPSITNVDKLFTVKGIALAARYNR